MKPKMKTEEMYATMHPWRLFFIVALPGMISMFAMSIYSVFEGAFIGQTLGEGAFAAVNIAFPLVFINFSSITLPEALSTHCRQTSLLRYQMPFSCVKCSLRHSI